MPATQSYTVTHVGISTARLALQAQGSAKNQTWFGRRRALPMRMKKHVECKTRTPLASPRAKAEFASPDVRAAVSAQVRPTPQQVKRLVQSRRRALLKAAAAGLYRCTCPLVRSHSQSSVTSSPPAAATWLYVLLKARNTNVTQAQGSALHVRRRRALRFCVHSNDENCHLLSLSNCGLPACTQPLRPLELKRRGWGPAHIRHCKICSMTTSCAL